MGGKREPTSYVRSRSPLSWARRSHELGLLETREGVDPNGSLGGVHLSFYHPYPLGLDLRVFDFDVFWASIRCARFACGRRVAPRFPNHDHPADQYRSTCCFRQVAVSIRPIPTHVRQGRFQRFSNEPDPMLFLWNPDFSKRFLNLTSWRCSWVLPTMTSASRALLVGSFLSRRGLAAPMSLASPNRALSDSVHHPCSSRHSEAY